MDNLEYLKNRKKERDIFDETWNKYTKQYDSDSSLEKMRVEIRKVYALEIIAEQMIHLDNTLDAVITTLENIETFIRQR